MVNGTKEGLHLLSGMMNPHYSVSMVVTWSGGEMSTQHCRIGLYPFGKELIEILRGRDDIPEYIINEFSHGYNLGDATHSYEVLPDSIDMILSTAFHYAIPQLRKLPPRIREYGENCTDPMHMKKAFRRFTYNDNNMRSRLFRFFGNGDEKAALQKINDMFINCVGASIDMQEEDDNEDHFINVALDLMRAEIDKMKADMWAENQLGRCIIDG